MSETFVESHRMRTWVQEGPAGEPRRWLLVARAQFLRYRRSWVFWTLVAAGVAFTLSMVIGSFGEMSDGGGVNGDFLGGAYALPAAWIVVAALLLAAAPSIAEDVRFHAPLFYFSRPLLLRDYLLGKAAFVAALLLVLVLPAALGIVLVSTGTWGADGPPPPLLEDYEGVAPERYASAVAYHQEDLDRWRHTHMDTFGDWLFASTILLVGTIVSIAFLAALTLTISSFTSRGWHASIALVVVLTASGMVGMAFGDLVTDGALPLVFAPALWPAAAVAVPITAYFRDPDPGRQLRFGDPLAGWEATAALSYVCMVVSTFLLLALTHRRLRRLGGAV